MGMPSPFQVGAAIGSNISGAFEQQRDRTALDDILEQANASGDEGAIDNAMSQILSKVSPERQGVALQILQNKQKNLQSQKEIAMKAAMKKQGQIMNPEAQKWAYKELEKKAPVQALTNSIAELRRLNKSDVTGPAAGRVPSVFANKEEDAIRKAIDANAIQILNVHKSMFPRGLTQGEFNTLSQKLVSSKNTRQANDAILNAYDRLAQLQEKKLEAVETATKQYGFDPMLPFIVSGIQKEFEDEEVVENRKLYQQVTGNEPSEEIEVSEITPTRKLSLEEIFR